jgi:tetratricopeptide (TPR) repeat protein
MSLWSRLERRIVDLAGELLLDEHRELVATARASLAKGDHASAGLALRSVLAANPEHGTALVLLGASLLSQKKPHEAKAIFERAVAQRPDDAHALAGHGRCLLLLGEYVAATPLLTRALVAAQGDRELLAEVYLSLGLAWRGAGNQDKAIRELRKAVAEAPSDDDARAALGEALAAAGTLDEEATVHLEKVSAAADGAPLAALARGAILLKERALVAARAKFSTAISEFAGDLTPWGQAHRVRATIGLADCEFALKEISQAHVHYLQALSLDTKNALVHARIGACHAAIGNFDAALHSYDLAISLGVDAAVVKDALAIASRANDPTRGARWATDLLGNDPTDLEALVGLGIATITLGERTSARNLLTDAAGRGSVDAQIRLATLDLEDGTPDAALRWLREALRQSPGHPQAREVLSLLQQRRYPRPGEGAAIEAMAESLAQVVTAHSELSNHAGEIARAIAELDRPLLVTVMGEFSSGKSSFVNAFIGAEAAPTGITPTTATINVVRYGRERQGRVLLRDGTVEDCSWEGLSARLRSMSPEQVREVDRVEILMPLPQLEQINIVDTPGLNSILPEHEKTARAFIAHADAVVWVFTASQAGKASERKALQAIQEEGKRVLGVLNKRDQLSDEECAQAVEFTASSLGALVQTVVPFSARAALAWKTSQRGSDGNWDVLARTLEEQFFANARSLKLEACARRLRAVCSAAHAYLDAARRRADTDATAVHAAGEALEKSSVAFVDQLAAATSRHLALAVTALYRTAAHEVIELVRPRRLPFAQHSASPADRDYLLGLLEAGFDAALLASQRQVEDQLLGFWPATLREIGRPGHIEELGHDLNMVTAENTRLLLAKVYDRGRAYVRGHLRGGAIDSFFRTELPTLSLQEDSTYLALVRHAPDLNREITTPLRQVGGDIMTAVRARLQYWQGVAEDIGFDLNVGALRAIDEIAAMLP